jgi:hypothetical protein
MLPASLLPACTTGLSSLGIEGSHCPPPPGIGFVLHDSLRDANRLPEIGFVLHASALRRACPRPDRGLAVPARLLAPVAQIGFVLRITFRPVQIGFVLRISPLRRLGVPARHLFQSAIRNHVIASPFDCAQGRLRDNLNA